MFNVINKIEKAYDKNLILLFENEVKICEHISLENKKMIEKLIEKNSFKGEKSSSLNVDFLQNDKLISMKFIGFGEKEKYTEDIFREVLFGALENEKGEILLSSEDEELLNEEIIGEILGNINYSFDVFKEKKSEKIKIDLFKNEKSGKVEEILSLIDCTDITRELVDQPANIINPETLARRAEELGEKYGVEVEIFQGDQLENMEMNLFLAVGRASVTKPRLIVMRYFGDPENNKTIGLVGKGLTYDTGGLCLKPADSMFTMKDDMSGSATVIGTMCAVAKNKLKKNVIAVIPACENSIDGNAYRPGDVLKSMNGKSVEIINTDAEGRLALADAITYAVRNESVTEIIDIATLTGAILVALGTFTTGVFANNDEMFNTLEKASKKHGEKMWRMPIFEEYADGLKSNIADIKHMGGRMGGSITAAKFLESFTEKTPWIHLDIAGTAYDNTSKWLKKGASGVGVKTLYTYIKNR